MKRRPVDSWFWDLFVQACGGGCCACLATGVKLERGHIIARGFGGTDALDNVLPVCLPCNKKYLKKETPDKRPNDWRERFFLLLGHVLRPQISVSRAKGLCNLIPATKQTENNTVIDWQNPDFDPCTEVFTQSGDRTYRQAQAAVRELIKRSQELEPRPKRPTAKRQEQMKELTIRYGVEAFRIAGEEFLREEPWVMDAKHGTVHHDSWLHACESFVDYLADGRERAVRLAERAKVERERDRIYREGAADAERESRLADYLRAAEIPSDWPGIHDGDAAIISTAIAAAKDIADAKAAGVQIRIRDVTEALVERSQDIVCRYKLYKADELLAEKNKLRDKLAKCVKWAKQSDAEKQKEFGPRIKGLSDWVDSTMDIALLREDSWPIDYLMQELDPDAPSAEEIFASGKW